MYPVGQDNQLLGGRFGALIVSDGSSSFDHDGGALEAAVMEAGGRIIATVAWDEAIDHIQAVGGRPVILLDTRSVSDERLAATLSPLDGLAAGRRLAIIAGIAEPQIDIVSAGLAHSRHEILCEPRSSDWIAALTVSQAGDVPFRLHDRVSESDVERLARLNAEMARISSVLARLSAQEEHPQPSSVGDPHHGFAAEPVSAPTIAAADLRQIMRARRQRDRFFGSGLFEDPAWDMMLDLYAAHIERAQVSVSSLCIAAAVAPTTALRWIARLTEMGLLERRPDPFDRRRAFMSLSSNGLAAMHRYIMSVRSIGLPLV